MPSLWSTPPIPPTLHAKETQVWQWDTATPEARSLLPACLQFLSEPERRRAESIRRPLTQAEFIGGRACARVILAHAIGCDPAALAFGFAEHGKPFVSSHQAPHFNLAHSGGTVLLALSWQGPVGVDLELRESRLDALEIAESNLHPLEVAAIRAGETAEQQQGVFLDIWTGKEAILKAAGCGLSRSLHDFHISPNKTRSTAIQLPSTDVPPADNQPDFYLHPVPAGQRFAAALATRQLCLDVQLFHAQAILETAVSALQSDRNSNANPVTYRSVA